MSDNSNNNCVLLLPECDSPIIGIIKKNIHIIYPEVGINYCLCVDWIICNEGVCNRIQNPTRARLSSSSDDDKDEDNLIIIYYNSKKKIYIYRHKRPFISTR